MPSELFLNPDALRHGADMLAQNCLAPDWFPTTVPCARENPVVGFGVPGAFFPFRECLQNCWMNRYGLLRCFSLARTHHSVHAGARDVHCALSKVDVSPLQSEQLALSQSRGGGDEYECPLTQAQTSYQRLSFGGCQHAWRCPPLCTPTN